MGFNNIPARFCRPNLMFYCCKQALSYVPMMVKLASIPLVLANFHELQLNCQNLKNQNHSQAIHILARILTTNTHAFWGSHLMAYIIEM